MTIRQLLARRKLQSDVAEEMREHVLACIDELVAQGVPLPVARDTARREFGNLALLEEQAREVWSWPGIEGFLHDLRFAARRLYHSPGFTVVCVLTLALGLGANLALFSLIQNILLKPLPFQNPDRLVMLYEAASPNAKSSFNVVAAGSFADWQRGSHEFAQMAMWSGGTRNLSGHGGQLSEQLESRSCTWNLFRALGVQPAYGRAFSAADDKPGAPATTILAWSLFQRRFGGDRSIVGRTVLLDGEPNTVIGVLPSWFVYPDGRAQLWTPAYRDSPAHLCSRIATTNGMS